MSAQEKNIVLPNNAIQRIAEQVVNNNEAFVVKVQEKGINSFVVYVDGQGAVTIEKCANWNRELRQRIMNEVAAFKEGNFYLEVSSFGVGSPLVDKRQYAINKGRKVVVEYNDSDAEVSTKKLRGVLSTVDEDNIQVAIQQDTINTVPIQHIKKIYIEPVF